MSTITEVTQKSQEQFLEAVRESQQAIVDAVSAWSQTVQGFASTLPAVPGADQLPTTGEIIDNTFDVAEKLVAGQREFAHSLVAAAAPATKPAAKATAKASEK
jgi:hypothetical protein